MTKLGSIGKLVIKEGYEIKKDWTIAIDTGNRIIKLAKLVFENKTEEFLVTVPYFSNLNKHKNVIIINSKEAFYSKKTICG